MTSVASDTELTTTAGNTDDGTTMTQPLNDEIKSDINESKMDNNNDNNSNNNNINNNDCSYWCCIGAINYYIESFFELLGQFIGAFSYQVLSIVLILLIGLSFGLIGLEFETDLFELWTPTTSKVRLEREFISEYWEDQNTGLLLWSGVSKNGFDTNILSDEYIDEWFSIHLDIFSQLPKKIYTWNDNNGNEYTKEFGYIPEGLYEPKGLAELNALAGQTVPDYLSDIVPCMYI